MTQPVQTTELDSVHIAIASSSLRHRRFLQDFMNLNGLKVVLNEPLSLGFIRKLEKIHADVVLLDVDEHVHDDDVLMDKLLDEAEVPIIFNDVTALTLNARDVLAKWYGKLLQKIAELTGRPEWEALDLDVGRTANAIPSTVIKAGNAEGLAENVWVLGASLGGPDAVKQFLSGLPGDLPVAFVLAQHLGANFMSLLADQLNRISAFRVMPAQVGHVLRHHEVLVVPVNGRLHINPIGAVELKPMETETAYSPSIDMVMADIGARYRARSGAIVFSGMGNDGVQGAKKMREHGGRVWAQEANSCVISAMPDNLRNAGLVNFSGTPEKLAEKLIESFS